MRTNTSSPSSSFSSAFHTGQRFPPWLFRPDVNSEGQVRGNEVESPSAEFPPSPPLSSSPSSSFTAKTDAVISCPRHQSSPRGLDTQRGHEERGRKVKFNPDLFPRGLDGCYCLSSSTFSRWHLQSEGSWSWNETKNLCKPKIFFINYLFLSPSFVIATFLRLDFQISPQNLDIFAQKPPELARTKLLQKWRILQFLNRPLEAGSKSQRNPITAKKHYNTGSISYFCRTPEQWSINFSKKQIEQDRKQTPPTNALWLSK